MAITAAEVKELREKTGAGMLDCKKALEEANGDMTRAAEILREKGLAAAAKKAGRIATEGVVESYIHGGGRIGVLVEVNCETDFVGKTDQFREFVRDIAMHIAASNPKYVRREEVPQEELDKEREILRTQALNEGKPEKVVEKIVEGRISKYFEENCLLEQPFVKDPDKTVQELLNEKISTIGENISIRRRSIPNTDSLSQRCKMEVIPLERPRFKRIVLKVSGESLAGQTGYGIDAGMVSSIAEQVKEVVEMNVEVAIVVGGGNIWRGIAGSAKGIDRATADYMGMLATVMNSLALQDALEQIGVPTRVQTSIAMQQIAEPYIRRRAIRHLEKGRVVIFAAGTGNPFFSTDTTAALRAAEIEAEVILMAKNKVDGVYSADPFKDANARKYDELTYLDVLNQNLGVMDSTASSLCMDNNIPLIVFSITEKGNIKRVVMGEKIGTIVKGSVK